MSAVSSVAVVRVYNFLIRHDVNPMQSHLACVDETGKALCCDALLFVCSFYVLQCDDACVQWLKLEAQMAACFEQLFPPAAKSVYAFMCMCATHAFHACLFGTFSKHVNLVHVCS